MTVPHPPDACPSCGAHLWSVRDAAAALGISRQRLHQLRARTGRRGWITEAELTALRTRAPGRSGRPKRTD